MLIFYEIFEKWNLIRNSIQNVQNEKGLNWIYSHRGKNKKMNLSYFQAEERVNILST